MLLFVLLTRVKYEELLVSLLSLSNLELRYAKLLLEAPSFNVQT